MQFIFLKIKNSCIGFSINYPSLFLKDETARSIILRFYIASLDTSFIGGLGFIVDFCIRVCGNGVTAH